MITRLVVLVIFKLIMHVYQFGMVKKLNLPIKLLKN